MSATGTVILSTADLQFLRSCAAGGLHDRSEVPLHSITGHRIRTLWRQGLIEWHTETGGTVRYDLTEAGRKALAAHSL